ncbi:hypothetical protein PLANPX_1205 [Lacipirellula parvula]|uniref:Uncharacterized protein n=2 Tax=Lacipirellula parvula TaxID=2650471 RepID=A0A5K7XBA4_9BACT|nr:hypothetical protein PLANPX_1205 [Lacipirellula parvula]
MKRYLSLAVLAGLMSVGGLTGCSDKASTKTETTVSTPEGETTRTTETTVEESGENPPPAN